MQYARGGISGKEYAARMAINGAALLAEAATGGMGGGVAVRTASMAARMGRAGQAIVKTAIVVDKADTVVSSVQAGISGVDAVRKGEYGRAALSAVQVAVSANSMKSVDEGKDLVEGMKKADWSPTHSQNGRLASVDEQSHHIIQNAAAENAAGYSRSTAPTTRLEGGSHAPGSPHDTANKMQAAVPLGGTYGAERDVAYLTLRAAGQSRGQAAANLERADKYFKGDLKMSDSTPLPPPSSRNVPSGE